MSQRRHSEQSIQCIQNLGFLLEMWWARVHGDEDEKRQYIDLQTSKGEDIHWGQKDMFLGSEEQGDPDPYSFQKRLKKLPGLILKLMGPKGKKMKSSYNKFSLFFPSASLSMV